MHEKRIQKIGNLLLVGELQRTLEWDPMEPIRSWSNSQTVYQDLPDTLEVHWTNLHHMAQLLALQNAVTTATSHSCHVEELGTINHMVICNAIWLNQKT